MNELRVSAQDDYSILEPMWNPQGFHQYRDLSLVIDLYAFMVCRLCGVYDIEI
jgi:hypothetical protein